MKKMLLACTWILPLLLSVASVHGQSQRAADGSDVAAVARIRARLTMRQAGAEPELSITAEIQDGYHVYAMTQARPFIATEIHVDPSDQFTLSGDFEASRQPDVHRHKTIDVALHEYEGEITWTVPLKLARGVDPGSLSITGYVLAQACHDSGCLAPERFPFSAELVPVAGRDSGSDEVIEPATRNSGDAPAEAVVLTPPTDAGDLAEAAQTPAPVEVGELGSAKPRLDFSKLGAAGAARGNLPLPVVLLTAFAAGLVLNFMPCVLPVIGLKVMAFVQQAGDSRGRIFALNLWYSLGLLSVFLVLATLAVFLGLGWGQQFSSVTFNATLASVVFVFALSFLGVWEIPIPGFVGSGRAHNLADKEGAAGAFGKGVLTTVLATPCSGPMLGSALTWAVSQPPAIAYAGFASVGLGMASPYLVIGAFPKLVGFLPKPGAWMETFKQSMGFVLLGTVVFLLTFIPIPYVVPAVAFMAGLGVACWWIGRMPLTEGWSKKLTTWSAAGAFSALIGLSSFGWLHNVMDGRFQRAVNRELSHRNLQAGSTTASVGGDVTQSRSVETGELTWQPYSHELLEKLTAQGKTVFIDFTADW